MEQPTKIIQGLIPENGKDLLVPISTAVQEESNLRYLFTVLWKRRWIILLFTLLVTTGVAIWTLKQPKIYKATSVVQIDLQAPKVLGSEVEGVEDLGTGSYWNNQEYLKTQYKIIESRSVSLRVVKMLNLDKSEELESWGISIKDKKISPYQIADILRSKLSISPVRDSRLVSISIEDTDPNRAAILANTFAEAYIEQNYERMLQATIKAFSWLSEQVVKFKEQLERRERELYEFKKEKNILSVSLEDRQNILVNQIQRLSEMLTEIKAKRIELKSKIDQLQKISIEDPLTLPLKNLLEVELIKELKKKYIELKEKEGEFQNIYGENHPEFKKIKTQLSIIETNLKREIKNMMDSIKNEYEAILKTEENLNKTLNEVQREALELNSYELNYKKLVREQETTEKLYNLLLNRSKETDLTRLLKVNNISILDRAITPKNPIKPKLSLNILLALLLGLLGGIGLTFLIESMDITIKSPEDIERLGYNILGILPVIEESNTKKRKHKRRIKKEGESGVLTTFLDGKSTIAESLRSIRTNILFSSPEKEIKTILITSPSPQDGKTTVAVGLAIFMAQSGKRVLLIDTDMRRPRIHKIFNINSPTSGISSYIIGESSLEESIIKTGVEGLDIFPCGPIPPNPSELLLTEKFKEVISKCKTIYDRIIFDSPPITAVTDAVILSTVVDGVILVLSNNKTRKDTTKYSIKQLKEVGSLILGVIINQIEGTSRDYYYYSYYYYYKYPYYKDDSETPKEELRNPELS